MTTILKTDNILSYLYVHYLRENGISLRYPSYFFQYRLMRPFIKQHHPFSYLRPGQKVLQIGSAAWTLNAGISQPLMMSTVVGASGQVLVMEPEKENVDALHRYTIRNRSSNISILRTAVWKKPCTKRLACYDQSSGAHIIEDVLDRKIREKKRKNKKAQSLQPAHFIELECDTTDNVLKNCQYEPDFINITVNGGEFEVLQGMTDTLRRNISITFPIFGPRRWAPDAFDFLSDFGFKITVSDTPPTVRGPGIAGKPRHRIRPSSLPQRLVAVAVKEHL